LPEASRLIFISDEEQRSLRRSHLLQTKKINCAEREYRIILEKVDCFGLGRTSNPRKDR